MANVYKIAFDIYSGVAGDNKVNYYMFDGIMLTDGSNTQVIKTDFNPTKIVVNPTTFVPPENDDPTYMEKNLHNGQNPVKYTFPN